MAKCKHGRPCSRGKGPRSRSSHCGHGPFEHCKWVVRKGCKPQSYLTNGRVIDIKAARLQQAQRHALRCRSAMSIRRMVMAGDLDQTRGGLTKEDLIVNSKKKRVVSRKRHEYVMRAVRDPSKQSPFIQNARTLMGMSPTLAQPVPGARDKDHIFDWPRQDSTGSACFIHSLVAALLTPEQTPFRAKMYSRDKAHVTLESKCNVNGVQQIWSDIVKAVIEGNAVGTVVQGMCNKLRQQLGNCLPGRRTFDGYQDVTELYELLTLVLGMDTHLMQYTLTTNRHLFGTSHWESTGSRYMESSHIFMHTHTLPVDSRTNQLMLWGNTEAHKLKPEVENEPIPFRNSTSDKSIDIYEISPRSSALVFVTRGTARKPGSTAFDNTPIAYPERITIRSRVYAVVSILIFRGQRIHHGHYTALLRKTGDTPWMHYDNAATKKGSTVTAANKTHLEDALRMGVMFIYVPDS